MDALDRFEIPRALDRIGDELAKLNKRLDHDEHFLRLTRELASLNESLQAIAYAALGSRGAASAPPPPGQAAGAELVDRPS